MVNIMKSIQFRRNGGSLAEAFAIEKADHYDEENAKDYFIKELGNLNIFGKTKYFSYPDIDVTDENSEYENDGETTEYTMDWTYLENTDFFLKITAHITLDTSDSDSGYNRGEIYSAQYDVEVGEGDDRKPFTDINGEMIQWIEEKLKSNYGTGISETWVM